MRSSLKKRGVSDAMVTCNTHYLDLLVWIPERDFDATFTVTLLPTIS